MDYKRVSLSIFIGLLAVYAILSGLNVFLPQGDAATAAMPAAAAMPAPLPVVSLVIAVGVFVIYGALGLLGLFLARKLDLPEIWDRAVTNQQRFLVPALIGAAIGILLMLLDLAFAPINGVGRLPHPPFPTSIVAALAAGIGEETIFRLFFISFWTWLISRVILRGRGQGVVFWVVAVFSAVAFALNHLPAIMYLEGWKVMNEVPAIMMAELLLLNGLIALPAAYLFKKFGFLAPVGVHFWADVLWHVIWGLL